MSYQIPSTVVWENTGFHLPETKVDKKVTIVVNAASKWTANSHAGGGGLYDARGWQGHKPGGPGYKVPTADEGCLIGKIEGTAFVFTFDPKLNKVEGPSGGFLTLAFDIDGPLSGSIFMGINDVAAGIGDNGGEMQVISIDWVEKKPRD